MNSETLDPVDELVEVLRETLRANELTLLTPATHGAPVIVGAALDQLARGLLARRVAEPSRVLAASATDEPVGPVRIRSANCRSNDHGDCLGMVEQEGITDCLCECHPFAASATDEPKTWADILATPHEEQDAASATDEGQCGIRHAPSRWVCEHPARKEPTA